MNLEKKDQARSRLEAQRGKTGKNKRGRGKKPYKGNADTLRVGAIAIRGKKKKKRREV